MVFHPSEKISCGCASNLTATCYLLPKKMIKLSALKSGRVASLHCAEVPLLTLLNLPCEPLYNPLKVLFSLSLKNFIIFAHIFQKYQLRVRRMESFICSNSNPFTEIY